MGTKMGTNENDCIVYFAVCPATGEVWEDTDFRAVYNAVRASLKALVHGSQYYEYLSAVISYGAVIKKDDGYFRIMHYAFRDICRVTVSGIAGKISKNAVEKVG